MQADAFSRSPLSLFPVPDEAVAFVSGNVVPAIDGEVSLAIRQMQDTIWWMQYYSM